MSAAEDFLTRWARRKRAAITEAPGQPKPKNPGDAAASVPPDETRRLFDPESLPPIETIGAGSDIRPFLAAGVPADLTREALRRAWSADPAIRGFIGLSENSWDFNAPGGVPGFGSLMVDDARRLLARVMEETEASGPAGQAVLVPVSESNRPTPKSIADQIKLVCDTGADHGNPVPPGEKGSIATHHERAKRESRPAPPRRRHGGAIPD